MSDIQLWGLAARRREVEGGVLLELERVVSTMDAARDRLRDGDDALLGVRADYQSKGRGRRGNAWIAPPGSSLMATYVVRGISAAEAGRLAFAAGVAVAEAVEEIAGVPCSLKWPNDVLAGGRKLAGILIEAVPDTQPPAALIGIGLNVNLPAFPPELRETATSLEIETGLLHDIAELEEVVRRALFAEVARPWEEILRRWRSRDATAGLRFLGYVHGEEQEGVAVGVTDEGELILDTAYGRISTLAATSLPPAAKQS
jgi:BirA family biotin operon repressor/biotin-[acetyl-CoA-carboxylase] ligase